MKRRPLIACTLIGFVCAACSSDEDTPQTNVDSNQPAANAGTGGGGAPGNATGGASPTGASPTGAAPTGAAPAGAAGAGTPGNAAGSSSEGTPDDPELDDGDGGSGNAAGPDGAGTAGAGMATGGAAGAGDMAPDEVELGVFVSTPSDSGGDLGGIDGADATCQALAAQVGAASRTWRAYLSTSTEDARDRIGTGPWVNANGITVATDLDALHAITGAGGTPLVDLFVDHEGNRINGQWAGSPAPNQHDILTGSAADGTALAATCNDWTSSTATPGPQVGHSDGLGPGMNATGNFGSWNSSHAPQGCSQQQLNAVGGAGRVFCFAAD